MLAVGLLAVAVVQGRWWSLVAAGAGALLTLLLSALVLRVDRLRRVEVAATRAKVAAEYAAEYTRYASDHRSVTNHLVELLETASNRIGILQRRVERLEGELAELRPAAPAAGATPAPGLASLSGEGEWEQLWPDLAEAPTVVDLVAWDSRAEEDALLPQELGDDGEQRTA